MTTLRDKMKDELKLRGLAIGTQEIYMKEVVKLYVHYKRSPAKLSQDEIKAYLLYLVKERNLAAGTYNVIVHALKFFYGVVLRRAITYHDFPLSKRPKKLPDILSSEDVTAIINAAFHIRDKAILVIAYGAGLRSAEVAHLKIDDIDSKRMLLHIRNGKGGKDRYAILSPFMLKTLRTYWCQCRSKITCETPWLFPGHNPLEHLSLRSMRRHFQAAKRRAGIAKHGNMHSLRHAFAMHVLESGEDIHTIKQLLGHASIMSTVHYLRMTLKKMKSVVSPIETLNL